MINIIDYITYLSIDWKILHDVFKEREDDCIQFVYRYIRLNRHYFSIGCKALEAEMQQSNNEFERIALNFLIESVPIEYSSIIMKNFIYSSSLSDFGYFCDVFVYLYVLVSIDRKIPFLLALKLFSSLVSFDGYKKIEERFDMENSKL